MNNKTFVRSILYFLVALMLVMNNTGVSASPAETLTGKVFTVSPTGVDDTANILHAFDQAKAAGVGSTVRLTAGNFRIRIMEVWDFDGYFKGAGQGATIIDTFADQDCQSEVNNNQWPVLLHFIRGHLRVSDLSFHITPAAPCQPYWMPWAGPDTYIDILAVTASHWNSQTDCAEIQKEKVSASLNRVTIEGENGDPDQFNVAMGIFLGGNTAINAGADCVYTSKFGQGTFQLTDATFRKVSFASSWYGIYNSLVVVSNNSFDAMNNQAIYFGDSSGSVVEVSNNRMVNITGLGVLLAQFGSPTKPFLQKATIFNIHNNDFSIVGEGNGVVTWDYDNLGAPYTGYPSTGKRAVLNLWNNHFTLNPANVWGIWLEGVDDAFILNNQFKGSSAPAFIAGFWGPTRRAKIAGNNLSKYSLADGSPYKIVLEAGTENYIVSGVPTEAVNDLGTNNWINGKKTQAMALLNRTAQVAPDLIAALVKRLAHGMHLPKQ
jgi:hypothetical protein